MASQIPLDESVSHISNSTQQHHHQQQQQQQQQQQPPSQDTTIMSSTISPANPSTVPPPLTHDSPSAEALINATSRPNNLDDSVGGNATTTINNTNSQSDDLSEQEAKPVPSTNQSTSDATSSILITLLLLTGARTSFTIDSAYLKRHSVEESNPLAITVYNLKECIWKDWKAETFDTRPASAHSIRLIYFGKLLEDRSQLKECRLQAEGPNVVHMTLRPSETTADDDTRSGKLAFGSSSGAGAAGASRPPRSSPSCRCVIL